MTPTEQRQNIIPNMHKHLSKQLTLYFKQSHGFYSRAFTPLP